MKIFFTGAQGTGKTTLKQLLSEELGLQSLDSVSRKLVETGKISQEQLSKGATIKTQRIIFNEYLKIFKNYDNLVSDRFLTDVLAYTRYMYHQEEGQAELEEMHREKSETDYFIYDIGLKDYFDSKDCILFYLPIEFSIENDGTREIDPEYQKEIDDNIKYFLKQLDIRYITLTGSVEERLKKSLFVIKNLT